MQLRMLVDYRGRWSKDTHFWRAGEVIDVDDATANGLLSEKRAEHVEAPASVAAEAPARAASRPKAKQK